jgi:hypothetical protein
MLDRRAVLVATVVHAAALLYLHSREPSSPSPRPRAKEAQEAEPSERIEVTLLPVESPPEERPLAVVMKGEPRNTGRSQVDTPHANDDETRREVSEPERGPHEGSAPGEEAAPPAPGMQAEGMQAEGMQAEGTQEGPPIALVRVGADQIRTTPTPKTPLILAGDRASSSSAPDVSDAKHSVEQSLREGMREHDQKLGLGPEGPIVRALGESTSASTAPITGRAMFSVTIDDTGKIATVALESTDGDRAGWSDARERAEKLLVGSPVTLRTKGRTAMRIEVQSSFKMPTGHDPGVDVELARIQLAKGGGKKATRIAILDPIPRVTGTKICLTPSDSDAPCPVEIPAVKFEITIFRLDGDVSNLGAKPRRVVHVHLLENRAL